MFKADPNESDRFLNPFFGVGGTSDRYGYPKSTERAISLPTMAEMVAGTESVVTEKAQELLAKPEDLQLFLWDVEVDADVLGLVANCHPKALDVLARVSSSSVDDLIALAQNGHEEALRRLVEVAESAAQAVGLFGTDNPVIREMAKERISWPVLASTRSEFAPQIDLKALGLGSAIFRLYRYVREIRIKATAASQKAGLMEKLKLAQHSGRMLSIEERAALLPEFNSESTVIKQWWKVAQLCLTEAYPHPTLAGEFNEQVPVLNDLVKAPSHRTTEGVLRHKILEKLENKFDSFGGWYSKHRWTPSFRPRSA
jgi:hypothetical protein